MLENLPADFITELNKNNVQEVILAVLKMDLGDIYLSDFRLPSGIESQLGREYFPFVESFGEEKPGGDVNSFLNPGNLETKTQRITLVRSDESKSIIDPLIREGVHNKRIEFYRWFIGMTSQPVLIDTLFCQDPIQLKEDSMLFSFDCVSCLVTENPKLWNKAVGEQVFPIPVGKAEGVPLVYLDSNPPHTVLTEELKEDYTGVIGAENTSGFSPSGIVTINGEKLQYSSKSATSFYISARAVALTDGQDHRSGSGVFPLGAVYWYGVCAGPVSSLSGLSSGGEEYSGQNAIFMPEGNPARVGFPDRLPYLFEDQDLSITDNVFYGAIPNKSIDTSTYWYPDINKKDGKAEIKIEFRSFSQATGTETKSNEAPLYLPSMPGDGPTYAGSKNLTETGNFSVSQNHGDPIEREAWREIRINSTAEAGDKAWVMIEPALPDESGEYYDYVNTWLSFYCPLAETSYMRYKLQFFKVFSTGMEVEILWMSHDGGSSIQGKKIDEGITDWFLGDELPLFEPNERMKLVITCLEKGSGSDPYAFVRLGGYTGKNTYYGGVIFYRYKVSEPSAWISSKFGKNLSSKGIFTSAKINLKGTIRNTGNKADGALKVYENNVEIASYQLVDGEELDEDINISPSSWLELMNAEIKIEVKLTGLDGEISSGSAGFEFSGGLQWPLSYTGSNLDNINVSYTSDLTCNATSINGANPTPADQIKYLIQGYTSYSDFIHAQDFIDRSAEYSARGHFLNGLLSGNLSLQEAYRVILKEGFARPKYNQGKIKLLNYITDQDLTNKATYDNSSLIIKKRGYETTGSENIIKNIVINYDKNNKTGIYEGTFKAGTGYDEPELNLDLVSSGAAVSEAGNFILSYKNKNLTVLTFEGIIWMIEPEKGDVLTLPDFLDGETSKFCKVISSYCEYGRGKNNLVTRVTLKCLKIS